MRATGRELIVAWLNSTSWRERSAVGFAALIVVGVVTFTLLQGYGLGAHIWRPGWLCANSYTRGSPMCVRDPEGGMR